MSGWSSDQIKVQPDKSTDPEKFQPKTNSTQV